MRRILGTFILTCILLSGTGLALNLDFEIQDDDRHFGFHNPRAFHHETTDETWIQVDAYYDHKAFAANETQGAARFRASIGRQTSKVKIYQRPCYTIGSWTPVTGITYDPDTREYVRDLGNLTNDFCVQIGFKVEDVPLATVKEYARDKFYLKWGINTAVISVSSDATTITVDSGKYKSIVKKAGGGIYDFYGFSMGNETWYDLSRVDTASGYGFNVGMNDYCSSYIIFAGGAQNVGFGAVTTTYEDGGVYANVHATNSLYGDLFHYTPFNSTVILHRLDAGAEDRGIALEQRKDLPWAALTDSKYSEGPGGTYDGAAHTVTNGWVATRNPGYFEDWRQWIWKKSATNGTDNVKLGAYISFPGDCIGYFDYTWIYELIIPGTDNTTQLNESSASITVNPLSWNMGADDDAETDFLYGQTYIVWANDTSGDADGIIKGNVTTGVTTNDNLMFLFQTQLDQTDDIYFSQSGTAECHYQVNATGEYEDTGTCGIPNVYITNNTEWTRALWRFNTSEIGASTAAFFYVGNIPEDISYKLTINIRDEESISSEVYADITVSNGVDSENDVNVTSYQTQINGTVTITASATGYGTRTIEYEWPGDTDNTTIIYMLESSSGLYQNFHVRNTATTPLVEVGISAKKLINSTWTLVASTTTDDSGFATLFLDPSATHNVTFTKTGYDTISSTLTPSETARYITMSAAAGYDMSTMYNGIAYTWNPSYGWLEANQTANQTIFYSVHSDTAELDYFGLNVTLNGTTYSSGEKYAGAGGTVNVSINLTGVQEDWNATAVGYWRRTGYGQTENEKLYYFTSVNASNSTMQSLLDDTLVEITPTQSGVLAITAGLFAAGLVGSFANVGAGGLVGMTVLGAFAWTGWFPKPLYVLLLIVAVGMFTAKGGRP